MTLTAILTPAGGSSKGMVVVDSIYSHFSASIPRLRVEGGRIPFLYISLFSGRG